MIRTIITSLVALLCSFASTQAQLAIAPALPTPADSITIVFDATQGNGALAGYSGQVYAHTGVLTVLSSDSSDWQYVVSDWGIADPLVQMDSVGPNLYQLKVHVADFYGFPVGELVTHLAFVFRSASGSLVGRDADGSDMYWPVAAGAAGGGYGSHTFDGITLHVFPATGPGIGLRAYSNNIIQVAPRPDTATTWQNTFSIEASPEVSALTEFADRLELDAGSLKAVVTKANLRLSFVRGADTLIHTQTYPSGTAGASGFFRMQISAEESWQGTGSRAIDINRRGRVLPVYNSQAGGYSYGAETMNIATPLAFSSKGYAILWDHEGPATWNIGASDPERLDYTTELDIPSLFVLGGASFDESQAAFRSLTGEAALPPRWALGFIQSKYGYRSTADALGTVDDLLDGNFPLDALVLDLYWFGDPGRMGDLDWDLSAFPDPPGFLNDLRSRGVQPILITEPYFTTASDNYSFLAANDFLATDLFGDPFVLGGFWTGPAALFDMTDSMAREWLWTQYDNLLINGPLGWWCDLGEPETHPSDMLHSGGSARRIHNHYSLEWARLLHDRYAALRPSERLFNLIRSGYTGMQRYGAIPWSGDVQRSWSGLQAQIPVMLGMSMSGSAWMHSDMGGFTGSFNAELYLRWTQLSAFAPVMRAHGVDNAITEPVYLNEPFRSHARNAIRLRYRLLPYHYSLARRYAATGRPMALPMDYFDPGNTALQNKNTQYFWGRDLLVAPVLSVGATSRSVTLPEGEWIHWFNESSNAGPGVITAIAPLGNLPLYVRAGSVLPMAPAAMANAGNFDDSHLELHAFAGNNSFSYAGECYLDNGMQPDAETTGAYELLEFNGSADATGHRLSLSRTAGSSWPEAAALRMMDLAWHRLSTPPSDVLRDGLSMTAQTDSAAWATAGEGWFYDESKNRVWVRFSWDMSTTTVELRGAAVGLPQAEISPWSATLATWPNPFARQLTWRVELPPVASLTLRLLNEQGVTVWQRNYGRFAGGVLQESLPADAMRLSPGVYVLQMLADTQLLRTVLVKGE